MKKDLLMSTMSQFSRRKSNSPHRQGGGGTSFRQTPFTSHRKHHLGNSIDSTPRGLHEGYELGSGGLRRSVDPQSEERESVRASTERGKNRFKTSYGVGRGTTISKEHTFPISPKRLDIESVVD